MLNCKATLICKKICFFYLPYNIEFIYFIYLILIKFVLLAYMLLEKCHSFMSSGPLPLFLKTAKLVWSLAIGFLERLTTICSICRPFINIFIVNRHKEGGGVQICHHFYQERFYQIHTFKVKKKNGTFELFC